MAKEKKEKPNQNDSVKFSECIRVIEVNKDSHLAGLIKAHAKGAEVQTHLKQE